MLLREIEIDHLPLDIVKRLNKKPIEFWAEILSGVNWAFKTNTDLRIEPNLTKANSKNFVVKDKRLSLFDRGMRSPHK